MVFEVMDNMHPDSGAPPLAPGGGVFLEYCGGEALRYCLLYRIVVNCCLNAYNRRSRRQGLLCRNCVWKWERNFWS